MSNQLKLDQNDSLEYQGKETDYLMNLTSEFGEKKKLSFDEQNTKEIEAIKKLSKEILDSIDKLSNIRDDITLKQKKDFMRVFNSFIVSAKEELRNKIDTIIRTFNLKLNLDTNQQLKAELLTFRNHAIRLNQFCIQLKKKVSDLTCKMNLMTGTMGEITKEWESSKSVNQKLLDEIKNEIEYHKQIEEELNQVKDELKRETEERFNIQAEYDLEEEKRKNYLNVINKLKDELKKERALRLKSECEMNRMASEKNKLENIFIDCIEETRKNIMARRMRENIRNLKGTKMTLYRSNSTKLFQTKYSELTSSDIKTNYDTFTPADKEKILEKFIFKEEVSKVLRGCLFINPEKERKLMETKNQLMQRLYPEIKGKTRTPKASDTSKTNDEVNIFVTKKNPISEQEPYKLEIISNPSEKTKDFNLFLTKKDPFNTKAFSYPLFGGKPKFMYHSFSNFK